MGSNEKLRNHNTGHVVYFEDRYMRERFKFLYSDILEVDGKTPNTNRMEDDLTIDELNSEKEWYGLKIICNSDTWNSIISNNIFLKQRIKTRFGIRYFKDIRVYQF